MSTLAIGKQILTAGQKYGKHKVPRFIYHMTPKTSYESMLKDGMINTSKGDCIGEGVFATELTNLFKRWRKTNSWKNESLQNRLIQQVSKGNDEIVILKIPTEKLNHDLLKIRSQNKLFEWSYSDKSWLLAETIQKEMEAMPNEKSGWIDKAISLAKKYLTKDNNAHIATGAPAKESHLYKQRKEAIEYIYPENIPISDVEKIGEVNIAELRASAQYDPTKPMRSIFTELLKGTPEAKGAELLKC